ncbi:MAG: 2TM domain-containing protein [Cyanobacteria bacterium P01_F01_bin.143]
MPDSSVQYPVSYTTEDIQHILQIAIARQGEDDQLTRQQLWEIAEELDLDLQTIQAAETDWLQLKTIQQKHQAFDRYRYDCFKQKLVKYAVINAFLTAINFFVLNFAPWSIVILLIWSSAIALNGWKTYHLQGEEYERAFQRWNFQNEVKKTVNGLWQRLYKAWQI